MVEPLIRKIVSFFYKGGGVWYIDMYSISISTLYFELSHGLFINSAKYPDMQMGVKYIQPQI